MGTNISRNEMPDKYDQNSNPLLKTLSLKKKNCETVLLKLTKVPFF